VDFSGRSVIVTGPELKLHQCGLPKKMALELFKPFIYSRLEAKGLSSTVKQAKKLVEKERPEVWDILDEVIREHPVMLNRAPTLHRLGIQAFEPVLVEGKAIQLHPLVCSAFNADFDGDQMAVHVPLSLEAQLEARVLMMSTNNVLSPANGAPIIVPSQDMILGLYYLTMEREGMIGQGKVFGSMNEVEHALHAGEVHLHSKVQARLVQIDEEGNEVLKRFDTTPGRVILGALLPMNAKAPFDLVNRLLRKKEVQQVIDTVYRYCGQKESVIFCDHIMTTGFRQAFKAGISFGKDDMVIPEDKWPMVNETRSYVKDFEQQYMDGLITQGEKYNKVVDAWSKCNDRVTEAMMTAIRATTFNDDGSEAEQNSVFMMANSGARGSVTQMKQLGGMRGLMAKPNGDIIETPIISNFKEGLGVLEYFNSTHGARKGLSDTALKTANSGYLTRRLVDVAQDCIIRMFDCGTETSITIEAAVKDGEVVSSLAERLLGRVTADDILRPGTDEVLVAKGQLIDERMADSIDEAGVAIARTRSPLTCDAEEGVCATCYGRDLARGTMVNTGEAVGIIAAQSIGEPGTQLTMRTFHIGGVAQGGQQSFQEAGIDGVIDFVMPNVLTNSAGEQLVIGRNMKLLIRDEHGEERASFKLTYGSKLFVKDGDKIESGAKLFEWDPYTLPILAEKDGTAKFVDLTSGIAVRDDTDDATGMTQRIVIDWRTAPKGNELKPEIILVDADGEVVRNNAGNPVQYAMSVDAVLSVEDGDAIKAGDVVARIPREGAKTKDITGGLPRVAELFEARRPKDHAIIAEIDGYVRFGRDYKNKRRISIESSNEAVESVEYMVPKGKHIPVQEGDLVQKGDYIMDGNPAPHDILATMGVEALADYMIHEVQEVYRLQGVKINDKHIEVIVRQMLQKWEVSDSGDTTLLKGEHVDKQEFDQANEKAMTRNGRPAQGGPILLGITKASLQTRSFISAASFQETTRVLTEASVQGKRDKLAGLKENVIVGRLIPAGTGGATQAVRKIASDRDNVVLDARREEAEQAARLAAPTTPTADDVFSNVGTGDQPDA
jgi:DNA-directed RNA polymerase subunit beta'